MCTDENNDKNKQNQLPPTSTTVTDFLTAEKLKSPSVCSFWTFSLFLLRILQK